MFIYNSKLINASDMSLSVNSAAINYGFSLFETIKLSNSKTEFLHEHINRLNNSLKSLNIDYGLDYESIKSDIYELICALDVEKGAIKIMVLENEGLYNTLITYSNRVYEDRLYRQGYKLMLSENKTNEFAVFTYHKTSNYGNNIFALRDAKSKGYDEVIFENTKGFISEGSLSNIFLVKDNIVYTPSIESGILAGIMRAKIIDALSKIDIKIVEKELLHSEFLEADEVFLSNSLMSIMPVSIIDEKKFDLRNYKMYKKIKKQLDLMLREDYFG